MTRLIQKLCIVGLHVLLRKAISCWHEWGSGNSNSVSSDLYQIETKHILCWILPSSRFQFTRFADKTSRATAVAK
jgi:hypothetical protein